MFVSLSSSSVQCPDRLSVDDREQVRSYYSTTERVLLKYLLRSQGAFVLSRVEGVCGRDAAAKPPVDGFTASLDRESTNRDTHHHAKTWQQPNQSALTFTISFCSVSTMWMAQAIQGSKE